MRRITSAVISAFDLRDLIGFAGFGLLVWGVCRINEEAGLIVAGALMIVFAISLSRK